MFASVALTRGRVIASSLPTVTTMVQPRTLIPLTEVTPSLLFSRKIFTKKLEILNPLKLKLGEKYSSGGLVQEAKGVRATWSFYDVLLRKRA